MKTVGIIGGGLSGLAAGLALAKQGIDVELFEANDKLGGCCATTQLQGYTFNDGAMYVAMPELLDVAFARIGLDRAALVPLRQITATSQTTLEDGTVVMLGADRAVKVAGVDGAARTAKLRSEIDTLLAKWQPVLKLFAGELLAQPLSMYRLFRTAWRHLPKFHGTVGTELERVFSDSATRAAMAGVLLYTGVPANQTPIVQILGLVALFDSGFYLPKGGMGAIPDALSSALLKHGGRIHTGARVQKIRVTRNRVVALDVEGHGTVTVDAVISTVSGMSTFGSLLDAGHVSKQMKRKAANAPLSQKALSVQLGLSNALEVTSHSISRLPMMHNQREVLAPSNGVPKWFNYTVPTVTMPELAPRGGSIIEMFPPIDQTWSIDRWTKEAGEAVAEAAITALGRIHTLDIVVRRVASPQDYRDRMHIFDGAVYGLSPAASPTAQFPHTTPIQGLFQAGQTTYPGYGTSTAMLSGIFAADALVRALAKLARH